MPMSPETDENLDSEGRLPGADVGSGGTAGSSLQHREEDDPQGRGANEEERQIDDEEEEEAQLLIYTSVHSIRIRSNRS